MQLDHLFFFHLFLIKKTKVSRCYTKSKFDDVLWVAIWSSQEDGGGRRTSWSTLSQGLHQSAAPLDCPDTLCGDVCGHQHFHLLQRLLQAAWGHVRLGKHSPRSDTNLWTGWKKSNQKSSQLNWQRSQPFSLSRVSLSLNRDSLEWTEVLWLTLQSSMSSELSHNFPKNLR